MVPSSVFVAVGLCLLLAALVAVAAAGAWVVAAPLCGAGVAFLKR